MISELRHSHLLHKHEHDVLPVHRPCNGARNSAAPQYHKLERQIQQIVISTRAANEPSAKFHNHGEGVGF